MISSSDFMGEVNISLQDLPAGQPLAKWFLLGTDGTSRVSPASVLLGAVGRRSDLGSNTANEEKEDGEDKKSKKKLGDMRVKIKYTVRTFLTHAHACQRSYLDRHTGAKAAAAVGLFRSPAGKSALLRSLVRLWPGASIYATLITHHIRF
jgi:hypothetical protein